MGHATVQAHIMCPKYVHRRCGKWGCLGEVFTKAYRVLRRFEGAHKRACYRGLADLRYESKLKLIIFLITMPSVTMGRPEEVCPAHYGDVTACSAGH